MKAILADEKKLLGVIKEEIMVISAKYGDDRRTSIGYDEYDIPWKTDSSDKYCHCNDKTWLYQNV